MTKTIRGVCTSCQYKFIPSDGKYWKSATVCDNCLAALLKIHVIELPDGEIRERYKQCLIDVNLRIKQKEKSNDPNP